MVSLRGRKRKGLRRGVTKLGHGVIAATGFGYGIDERVLGVSCGFALRATVGTFWVVETMVMWMVVVVYGLAVRTVRALCMLLDWMGATY